MITIEQSNKYPQFFIKGELPSNVLNVLMRECSYWIEGIEHSKKFKENKTNGYCYLLRKSKNNDYYFPVGLVDRVKGVLDAYGIEYEIKKPTHHIVNLGLSWNEGYSLREYQLEVLMKAIEKEQGVISLPTGAGKTLVGLALIHALDTRTLIVVHTRELFYQWRDRMEEVLNYSPGMVGDGVEEWMSITVAMMQTVSKKDFEDYDTLIIDECHHAPCNSIYRVAMKSNARYRYGLSATPRREDGADMKIWASTGEIISNVTVIDLIEWGYLAKPQFIFLDPPPVSGGRNWQQEYSKGIVQNEGRNQMIVAIVNKYLDKGLSVYVHVERINHGEILSNRLDCPFLSGRDSKKRRDEVLRQFEDGDVKVLVSTLLGEGVDIPKISVIVMSHGQKTSVGTLQKVGRALRVNEEDEGAVIIDFADKGRYLGRHWENRYYTYKEFYGDYV